MSTFVHDPKAKQTIRSSLIKFVYNPIWKELDRRLNALVVRNSMLGGYSHKSFVHRGILYSYDSSPPPRPANRLISQLIDEFDSFLRDQKAIAEMELPYTKGFITHVLNQSDSVEDYKRLLPEALHPAVMEYANYCVKPAKLTDEDIDLIRRAHQNSISLLKQRMVRNLLM